MFHVSKSSNNIIKQKKFNMQKYMAKYLNNIAIAFKKNKKVGNEYYRIGTKIIMRPAKTYIILHILY